MELLSKTSFACGDGFENTEMEEDSQIRKFYSGRTILITGVSGFIGKVLLWKLLHTCWTVDKIYVLIRAKKGQGVQSRIETIFKTPIYDELRQSNTGICEKVVAIHGDIAEDGLDLADDDRNILINQVSIVFHIAAALNMDNDLKTAVNMNTLGTLRMLQLCSQMKNLEAFVHTSTAYCYCEKEVTEEAIFAPHADPYNVIHLTKWMSSDLLRTVTPGLIKPHPNTYTFTKRLAEKLVADHFPELPVIITRPSTVIPSLKEPFRGWVDNLNGPVGLMVAAGKGVCRSMLGDGSGNADLVAVDIVSNSLLAVAWKVSQQKKEKKLKNLPVLNIASSETVPLKWQDIIDIAKVAFHKYPFSTVLWYPGGYITTNRYMHAVITILLQWLPAYFLDFFLKIFSQKPFMVNVQRKILQGQKVLQYFTMRKWIFTTKNLVQLQESMNSTDQKTFPVTMKKFTDRLAFMEDSIKCVRKYILKEDDLNLPQCRKRMKLLYIVDCLTKFFGLLFLLWLGTILVSNFIK